MSLLVNSNSYHNHPGAEEVTSVPNAVNKLINDDEMFNYATKQLLILPLPLIPDTIKDNNEFLMSWVNFNKTRTYFSPCCDTVHNKDHNTNHNNDVYQYIFTFWCYDRFLRPDINDNEVINKLVIKLNNDVVLEYVWNSDSTLDSKITYYYDDGVKNNVKNGICKQYYKSGSLQSHTHTVNNMVEGVSLYYYNILPPSDDVVVNNQTYSQQYQQLQRSSEFKNNKLNGITQIWDKGGNLVSRITYKDGVEHGNFNIWSDIENRYVTGEFINGKIINSKINQ